VGTDVNLRSQRRVEAMDEARRISIRWMGEASDLIERRRLAVDRGDTIAARAFETASAERVLLATIAEPLGALGWFLDWAQNP
jgi:hypothetical protein